MCGVDCHHILGFAVFSPPSAVIFCGTEDVRGAPRIGEVPERRTVALHTLAITPLALLYSTVHTFRSSPPNFSLHERRSHRSLYVMSAQIERRAIINLRPRRVHKHLTRCEARKHLHPPHTHFLPVEECHFATRIF